MQYTDAATNHLVGKHVTINGQPAVRLSINGETVTIFATDLALVVLQLAKLPDTEPEALNVSRSDTGIYATVGGHNVASAYALPSAWIVCRDHKPVYTVRDSVTADYAVDLILYQDGHLQADADDVSAWRAIVNQGIVRVTGDDAVTVSHLMAQR